MIDELDIPEGTTIEQAAALLKGKVPDFQYVLGQGGSWRSEKLPKMHLVNFTLDSAFLMLRHLYPTTFQIGSILDPDEKGAKQIFSVGNFEDLSGGLSVQVFSLSNAIDRQVTLDLARGQHGSLEDGRKRAMNAVLSLLENVEKQTYGTTPVATLSIHDETETLIARGDAGRVASIYTTLKALEAPVDQSQLRTLQTQNNELWQTVHRLQSELAAAKDVAAKAAQSK